MTDEESESDEAPKKRKLTMQEKAIYLESDALQIEMGNIVSKTGTGGTSTTPPAPTSIRIAIQRWLWQCDTLQSWRKPAKGGCFSLHIPA